MGQYRERTGVPARAARVGWWMRPGCLFADSNDAATNNRFRIGLRLYPVATAPGTDDLIPATIVCSLRSWIHLHDQRLRVALATRGQLHHVGSRQHVGNIAASEAATTRSRRSLRRSRTQIPHPPM